MKVHESKIITMLLCLAAVSLFVITAASADVLCAKKAMKATKRGKIAFAKGLRNVQGSTCPRGYLGVLNTTPIQAQQGPQGPAGPQGPQGPQGPAGSPGPQGPAGKVDLESCVNEEIIGVSCPEGTVCDLGMICGDTNTKNGSALYDYMLTWSWITDTGSAYLAGTALTFRGTPPVGYPTGITISTTSETGYGAHTAVLRILCCLPN